VPEPARQDPFGCHARDGETGRQAGDGETSSAPRPQHFTLVTTSAMLLACSMAAPNASATLKLTSQPSPGARPQAIEEALNTPKPQMYTSSRPTASPTRPAADHPGAGVRREPVLQRAGLAAGQDVDGPSCGGVDQDGAVDVPFAQREVDAEYLQRTAGRLVPLLTRGMPALADRACDSGGLRSAVTATGATGAMFLCRGTSTASPPVLQLLEDNSYLSELDGLQVRVIDADMMVRHGRQHDRGPLADLLNVRPPNMRAQAAESARLGFLTKTCADTHSPDHSMVTSEVRDEVVVPGRMAGGDHFIGRAYMHDRAIPRGLRTRRC
jgi:hypothetical protein